MALQWKNFLRSYNPTLNHLFANGLQMKKAFQQLYAKRLLFTVWAHLGSNQGPPDYESGALTN